MKSPDETSLGQVIKALLDEDTPLKPRYLYRLSDLTDKDLAQVKQNWKKIPLWRRQALMEDIAELGEGDYMLSYESLGSFTLEDEDPKVRLFSVQVLGEYEQPELARRFLQMLTSEVNLDVKAALADALGKYVYLGDIEELDEETLQDIEAALLLIAKGSEDPQVRRSALESLGYSRDEQVRPLIEIAFASSDPEWVSSALAAMGHSADEAWAEPVIQSLEHHSPGIRQEAARAAGELELAEAVEALKEMLDDTDDEVRMAAIWSLSQIGGEGVRDLLEQLAEMTEDEDDLDFIESALDNLTFTEELESFALIDVEPEDLDRDDDDDEFDEVDESSILDDEADED